MEKQICIVTTGDPNNPKFNYGRLAVELRQQLREGHENVELVSSAEEGIGKLDGKGGRIVFLSAYFCNEALLLARRHGPKIRFVVYSVGLPPPDIPVFLFRGMATPQTFGTIFD